MATQYHVYKNDGAGGPVNYASPVTSLAGLTYSPSALALGSDNTFAVRAYDTVSGYEELNVDARVRILLDGSGVDITNRPTAPIGVSAVPTAGGSTTVRWGFPLGGGGIPTGFHVYRGTPSVSYGSPVATIPYVAGQTDYSASITGLSDGVSYQVAVRAYNATAEETNTQIASVTGYVTGPSAVTDLAGSVVA